MRNRIQPARAGGDFLHINEHRPHDFAKAQRDDRQIIAAQPQRRCAQNQPHQRRAYDRAHQRRGEAELHRIRIDRENARDVHADGKKRGDAQLQQAGIAHGHIQRQRQNAVNKQRRKLIAEIESEFAARADPGTSRPPARTQPDTAPAPSTSARPSGTTVVCGSAFIPSPARALPAGPTAETPKSQSADRR